MGSLPTNLLPAATPITWPALIQTAQSHANRTLEGWDTYQVNLQAKVTSTPSARQESYLMLGQGAAMAAMQTELQKDAVRTSVQLWTNHQPLQPLPTASQLQLQG